MNATPSTVAQLGDLANQLVLEAQRSVATNMLRPYADALIRAIARETRSLSDTIDAGQAVFTQIQQDDGQVASLLVSALAMRRNKRAMLLYHSQRIDMLRSLFWESGGQLSMILGQDKDTRKNMAPAEVDFVRGYAQLATDYRAVFSKAGLDLTSPTMGMPPTQLMVQVRVLTDLGDIETEHGTVSLTRDSLVNVRRADVERLIQAGHLEVVT